MRGLECLLILSLLCHHILREEVPEVEANFEKLLIIDTTHLSQIGQALQGLLPQHLDMRISLNRVGQLLDKIDIILEN